MNATLEKILEGYKDDMVKTLQEFVRVKSVATRNPEIATEDAPFGPESKAAMDFIIDLEEKHGFECTNYGYWACEFNFGEAKEDAVGTALHVDVVPEGKGWTVPAYGGDLIDGKIYGRGTTDNKGPAIACFYAALAIKESGLPLSKNVTQIFGGGEEIGRFDCIHHYLKNAKRIPSCGIIPDSVFPICFAEKHFMNYTLSADSKTAASGDALILKEIQGGEAMNVVPSWAEAVFTDSRGNEVKRIRTAGKTAHASRPSLGENAISKLLIELKDIDFEPADIKKVLTNLVSLEAMGCDGAGIGNDYTDETGSTTDNMGLISYKDGHLVVTCNVRFPLTMKFEDLVATGTANADAAGLVFEAGNHMDGFYIDPEDELAKTLVKIYRDETGEMETQPLAHGAGSYARIMDRFVPFGPGPQTEALRFHMEDEYLTVEHLFSLSKMYAEALYQLAK